MTQILLTVFFFFSSRRRHTSSTRDWSSDVCSSDLLVDDADAAASQPVIGARETLDGPEPAQHEIAEGAGDEFAVGLEKHHFDGRIGHAHVARGGGPAPPAPDDHDAPAALGGDVSLHRARAPCEAAGQTEPDGRRPKKVPTSHPRHIPWPPLFRRFWTRMARTIQGMENAVNVGTPK